MEFGFIESQKMTDLVVQGDANLLGHLSRTWANPLQIPLVQVDVGGHAAGLGTVDFGVGRAIEEPEQAWIIG